MSHPIVHWELMGPDGDALADFYQDIFGWKSEAVPGFNSYNMVSADDAGGVAGAVGQGNEHMPAYQAMYVQVESIDEHLEKITAARGTAVMPRTVVPGMVTFAMFNDPAGNLVGLVEAETPPAE